MIEELVNWRKLSQTVCTSFNTLKFILCYSKFDLLYAINIKQQEYYIHTFTHLAISVFLVPIPLNSLSEK